MPDNLPSEFTTIKHESLILKTRIKRGAHKWLRIYPLKKTGNYPFLSSTWSGEYRRRDKI